jgi:dinuclear metal center YbgI/SA1388 family protein
MKISDITTYLESIAPTSFQEQYDNSGLIIGNPQTEISSALLSIDITEEVIDEAIKNSNDIIISHHPIVFSGLKRFNGSNYVERCVIKAIKNDIAIYAAHTNFDSIKGGVNTKICDKIGLKNCSVLAPMKGQLLKLVTYIPKKHTEEVREAVFNAGAGDIGNYKQCSYNTEGVGTFMGNEDSNPFAGEKGKLHYEGETRFETILPKHLKSKVLKALINTHPYEEVAYDFYALENDFMQAGMGMVGILEEPTNEIDFLLKLKEIFGCHIIRHTKPLNKQVKKVAVCGGSGSFLLKNAIALGADIFVTGDYKYHQFFDAEDKIVIADIGHYESEQFTKDIFYEILTKKFPRFALYLSEVKTNPIQYL